MFRLIISSSINVFINLFQLNMNIKCIVIIIISIIFIYKMYNILIFILIIICYIQTLNT